MEEKLGRFAAQVERPEPLKFAWPIVVLPELFTSTRHLGALLGYLATIGWEVYAPDLRAMLGRGTTSPLARFTFADLLGLANEALDALGREAIVMGHGVGGLAALKLAERARVKAAVAYAPAVPGFASPLVTTWSARIARWRGRPLNPPAGRAGFEFVADAEPYQREAAIRAMVPDSAPLAFQIARGGVEFAPGEGAAPRLIVAGDSDPFAPLDTVTQLAQSIGARLVTMRSRGHWLIGGRALERAINETQRFLVRALGQDLLLLYPAEWKSEEGGED
ncbi:MAG TPA: alpha/beta fold hydrolase [Candidatus Binataceae bacterium]|nr:alpha/beta fold hydrolase [Candidatus Binataceae bacterium]